MPSGSLCALGLKSCNNKVSYSGPSIWIEPSERSSCREGSTVMRYDATIAPVMPPDRTFSPSREELNLSVLHAFVDLHEFTDLNLVQALR